MAFAVLRCSLTSDGDGAGVGGQGLLVLRGHPAYAVEDRTVADELFDQIVESGLDLCQLPFQLLFASGWQKRVEEVLCLPPCPGLGQGGVPGAPVRSERIGSECLCQLGVGFIQALEELAGLAPVRLPLVRRRQRVHGKCVSLRVAGSCRISRMLEFPDAVGLWLRKAGEELVELPACRSDLQQLPGPRRGVADVLPLFRGSDRCRDAGGQQGRVDLADDLDTRVDGLQDSCSVQEFGYEQLGRVLSDGRSDARPSAAQDTGLFENGRPWPALIQLPALQDVLLNVAAADQEFLLLAFGKLRYFHLGEGGGGYLLLGLLGTL